MHKVIDNDTYVKNVGCLLRKYGTNLDTNDLDIEALSEKRNTSGLRKKFIPSFRFNRSSKVFPSNKNDLNKLNISRDSCDTFDVNKH